MVRFFEAVGEVYQAVLTLAIGVAFSVASLVVSAVAVKCWFQMIVG